MWNGWTSGDNTAFEASLDVNGEAVVNLVVTGNRGGAGEVAAWEWLVWSDRLRAETAREWFGSAPSLREGQRAAIRAAGRLFPYIIMPPPAAAVGRREGASISNRTALAPDLAV